MAAETNADGRILRYVNAGHHPQFVLHASRGGITPLGSTGMPIALYAAITDEPNGVLRWIRKYW